MLALTLAAAFSLGAPVPPPRPRPVYDFAAMTPEQAQALAGRGIRVKANITDPDPECAGAGEDDAVERWVAWRRGDETANDTPLRGPSRLVIEARAGRVRRVVRPAFATQVDSTAPSLDM